MPRYEYRCRACGATFERNRPMAEASAPAKCPQGHDDTVKLLSTVSLRALGRRGGLGHGPVALEGRAARAAAVLIPWHVSSLGHAACAGQAWARVAGTGDGLATLCGPSS